MATHGGRVLSLVEGTPTASLSTSVSCNSAFLAGANGNSTVICRNAVGILPGGGGTASGNIDPVYGQYFTGAIAASTKQTLPSLAASATTPLTALSQAGLPVVAQSGWGGGPNVTLGPPAGNYVWGVHTTPYTFNQTAAQMAVSQSVRISWYMGSSVLNVPAPNGQPVATNSPAAFVPALRSFAATITYGVAPTATGSTASFSGNTITCLQYWRPYTAAPGLTYTSPYICHVTLTGLAPTTSYAFTISANVTNTVTNAATTYATPAATVSSSATAYNFNTMIPASSNSGQSAGYPFNWVLMADVGQTYNSSLTAQYISVYDNSVVASAGGLDLILNVADLTYADNYSPDSVELPQPAGARPGTNQQRWDSMFAMWAPVFGGVSVVHAAGNHEIDNQPGIALSSNDTSSTYGYTNVNSAGQPNIPFQSWSVRVPNGAMDPAQLGDTWNAQYFSQNLGPVHLIVLNNYIPFATGTAQYNWFAADIAKVDRVATPWLIVSFHAPPYHSYYTHYKEMECFMSFYEPLFYKWRVDFVINGHVHAYERTHPMYNYQKDNCGPVYITIGDGGNVEGPYRSFVDDIVPGTNQTFCQAGFQSGINSNPFYAPSPSYQTQVHPANCPITSYQPASGKVAGPGVITNPAIDPSQTQYFCQTSQPVWSAYRDPSFGFAGLTFQSDTTATYNWYRNVDQTPGASTLTAVDTATYTRSTGFCAGNTPALEPVATTLFSPAPAVFSGAPYASPATGTYTWGSNAAMLQNVSALGMNNPVGGAFTPVTNTGAWRTGDAFVTYPTGFSAGVQSGDPLPGQIILWTRFQPSNDQSAKAAADPSNTAYVYNYLPASGTIPITVSWWVSTSNSATSPAPQMTGTYLTDGSRDWVVKLDVNYSNVITVTQQQTLYYGFSATDTATNTAYTASGSFRAILNANMASLNYAVVSCSNWGFGYFNVYNARKFCSVSFAWHHAALNRLRSLATVSNVDNLDFWAHVGDNIYEYKDLYCASLGINGSLLACACAHAHASLLSDPDSSQKVRPVVTDPPTEIVTLDDYRRRYRLYRLDQDLQALTAKVPLISITDDHEYVNNAVRAHFAFLANLCSPFLTRLIHHLFCSG